MHNKRCGSVQSGRMLKNLPVRNKSRAMRKSLPRKNFCRENQILIPNFEDHSWDCVDNAGGARKCPGATRVQCPADPVVPEAEECYLDCELGGADGQLLVAQDCSTAFLCSSRWAGGGRDYECPEGTIIHVDTLKFRDATFVWKELLRIFIFTGGRSAACRTRVSVQTWEDSG